MIEHSFRLSWILYSCISIEKIRHLWWRLFCSSSFITSGWITYVCRVCLPCSCFDTVIKRQRTQDTTDILSLTNSVRLVARQRKANECHSAQPRRLNRINVYERSGLAIMRMDLLYTENNVTQTSQFNDT